MARPLAQVTYEAKGSWGIGSPSPQPLALVDGQTLEPIEAPESGARLLAATRLGAVRLIDHSSFQIATPSEELGLHER